MTINEYQKLAMRTDGYYDDGQYRILNGVIGLCGEAGECLDLVKKIMFQGHKISREKMAEEIGDVGWYLALCADAIGYSLEDVLEMNIEKLKKRYPDGFDSEKSVNRNDEKT